MDLAWKLKQTLQHESDGDTNCNRFAWNSHQKIGKAAGRFENKNTSGDYPNDGIVKICQNTEKSSGPLRRLKLQWKTIG